MTDESEWCPSCDDNTRCGDPFHDDARAQPSIDVSEIEAVRDEMRGRLGHITNGHIKSWAQRLDRALKGEEK